MKKMLMSGLAAVILTSAASVASAQFNIYIEPTPGYGPPPPGYGPPPGPGYGPPPPGPYYRGYDESRPYRNGGGGEARYYRPGRYQTWNGCQRGWTVQDGLCKPYRGY